VKFAGSITTDMRCMLFNECLILAQFQCCYWILTHLFANRPYV